MELSIMVNAVGANTAVGIPEIVPVEVLNMSPVLLKMEGELLAIE